MESAEGSLGSYLVRLTNCLSSQQTQIKMLRDELRRSNTIVAEMTETMQTSSDLEHHRNEKRMKFEADCVQKYTDILNDLTVNNEYAKMKFHQHLSNEHIKKLKGEILVYQGEIARLTKIIKKLKEAT
jgi:hypothetical protein